MQIYITPEAHGKIFALVNACPDEINGIGRLVPYQDGFLVEEIFVPSQMVSGSSAEMDTDSIANFLAGREDFAQWKLQWHSHVNMGVFWSPTDEEAIRTMGSTGDWLLSMVFNKQGQYKARIDAFHVNKDVPQALADLFPAVKKQLTKDDLTLTVLYPDADYSLWAADEVKEKVRHWSLPGWSDKGKKSGKRHTGGYRWKANKWQEVEEDELDRYNREQEAKDQDEFDAALARDADLPPAVRWAHFYQNKVSILQAKAVVAQYLSTTVAELDRDYDEEAIKDFYEDWASLTDRAITLFPPK